MRKNALKNRVAHAWTGKAAVLATTLFFGWGTPMMAQSIWDGGGDDNNLFTPENWDGDSAPVSGNATAIQFAGSTRTSPVLNSDLTLQQITFNSGANSFTLGGTGVISLYGTGPAGADPAVGIVNSSAAAQTVNNSIKLVGKTAIRATSGDLTIAGNIDRNGNGLYLRGANGTTLTISGGISGANSTFQLRGTNTSTVRLSGNNTFVASSIQAWEGTILAASDNAFGISSNQISMGQSTLTSNVAILTEGTRTIANLVRLTSKAVAGTYTLGGSTADVSTFSGNIIVNTNTASSAAMPLTLTAAAGGRVNFTGLIARDGNSTGTGDAITKTGSGIVSLQGANTYSGGTTVSAGTLLINNSGNNSGTGTGAISVSSGATLGGSGRILGGLVTLAGGAKLSAGDMDASGNSLAGEFRIPSLNWHSNNTTAGMFFDLGATSDLLTLSGAFNKGTGTDFIFDFSDAGGLAEDAYTLLTFSSTTFLVEDFSYTSKIEGFSGNFILNANNLQFQVTSVPESSTWALLGIGLGLLLFRGVPRRTA